MSIRVWCVTANHGVYGNDILCSRVGTDKEDAIQDCLSEVIRHTQPAEKNRLKNDSEAIVETLMNKNEYVQSEDGLRMVAELHELEIEMSFIKKIKTTDDKKSNAK